MSRDKIKKLRESFGNMTVTPVRTLKPGTNLVYNSFSLPLAIELAADFVNEAACTDVVIVIFNLFPAAPLYTLGTGEDTPQSYAQSDGRYGQSINSDINDCADPLR